MMHYEQGPIFDDEDSCKELHGDISAYLEVVDINERATTEQAMATQAQIESKLMAVASFREWVAMTMPNFYAQVANEGDEFFLGLMQYLG